MQKKLKKIIFGVLRELYLNKKILIKSALLKI
jgi:hypothetical protein